MQVTSAHIRAARPPRPRSRACRTERHHPHRSSDAPRSGSLGAGDARDRGRRVPRRAAAPRPTRPAPSRRPGRLPLRRPRATPERVPPARSPPPARRSGPSRPARSRTCRAGAVSGPAGRARARGAADRDAGAPQDALGRFVAQLDALLSAVPGALGAGTRSPVSRSVSLPVGRVSRSVVSRSVAPGGGTGGSQLFVGATGSSGQTGATVTPDPTPSGSQLGVVGVPGISGPEANLGL